MIDDYSNFCEMFFAAHYLPIALYKGHQYVCSAGFYDNKTTDMGKYSAVLQGSVCHLQPGSASG